MPEQIKDRDADVWEALLAVADAAGGRWPEMARVSAVTLVTASKADTPSLGIRLLADLKSIWRASAYLPTIEMLTGLNSMEESPWGDLRGKPLDARGLAALLRPYGVKPATVRTADGTSKGYRREDLADAWSRYLGPPSVKSVTFDTSDRLVLIGSDAPLQITGTGPQ